MICDKPRRRPHRAIRLISTTEMACVHSEFDIRSHLIGRGRRKMHPISHRRIRRNFRVTTDRKN